MNIITIFAANKLFIMIFPDNFEEKTSFNSIRTLLKARCLSTLGKSKVDALLFSDDFDFIQQNLFLSNEFLQIIHSDEEFPIQHFFDLREALSKLEVEGAFFELQELFDLKRSLEEIKAIHSFFEKTEDDKYPELKKLAGKLPLFPYIINRINQVIDKQGKIRNKASTELADIRSKLAARQSSVSKIMHGILQRAKQSGYIDSDVNLSVRNGKMLIPVPSGSKRRIKGIVVDESATGKTSFVEPIEIVEHNNEIRELEFAERREIIRILKKITEDIRPYADDLILDFDFLAEIDFIRAKALFSVEIDAVVPKLSMKKQIKIQSAKHPLLYLSFLKENREVVPLDIYFNDNQRVVLISGPNAGGKSVCLKTVGLLQYMLQCGLPVPVSKNSVFTVFNKLFIDIGDEQSIEDDLSTYSSHLKNMKYFVENADNNSMILIDEFGSGTEPTLGGAIAEAVLDNLLKNRVFGLVTTHYGNLKHFATAQQGIVNGAMLFDTENMKALYRLELGRAGSSYAFEIARNIGLPREIILKAEEIVGKEHIDFDKNLKKIEQERKRLNDLNQKLKNKEIKLESILKKYEQEAEAVKNRRKEIINEAKQTADKILSGINKTLENTIYEIKKSNADKEKIKQSRQKLENLKENVRQRFENEEKYLTKKVEKLKNKQNKKKKTEQKQEVIIDENIGKGDKVQLETGGVGEVLEKKGNKFLVSLGNMQMYLPKGKIKKISNNAYKKQAAKPKSLSGNYDVRKTKIKFSHNLDVRGKRAEEALQIVSNYLDQAVMVEAKEVKILHGTGNGILRQLIRDYLKTYPLVKHFKDEKIELGGAGITVVEFAY
ncbi:MAG: endonuclease MutS2 [Bacteroidales bacterium]|nr:endonuclease MutS2 [Bacteroidales bacterium]